MRWLIVTQDFPPGFVGGIAAWSRALAAQVATLSAEEITFWPLLTITASLGAPEAEKPACLAVSAA